MATYDLRVILETYKGNKFSYVSSSIFNSAIDTNYAVSASTFYNRLTGSVSCSYQNTFEFTGTINSSKKLVDDTFLSCSYVGNDISGSVKFNTTGNLVYNG